MFKYRDSHCLLEKVRRQILFNTLHSMVMHNSDDGTSNLESFSLWTLSITPYEEMATKNQ